jgi:hypothetical protein
MDLQGDGAMMSESYAKKIYIPKMLNIEAIMELNKTERETMLSLITSNSSMRSEISVMLETKGILTNVPE